MLSTVRVTQCNNKTRQCCQQSESHSATTKQDNAVNSQSHTVQQQNMTILSAVRVTQCNNKTRQCCQQSESHSATTKQDNAVNSQSHTRAITKHASFMKYRKMHEYQSIVTSVVITSCQILPHFLSHWFSH